MNIRKRLENRGIMVEERMEKGEDFGRRWNGRLPVPFVRG